MRNIQPPLENHGDEGHALAVSPHDHGTDQHTVALLPKRGHGGAIHRHVYGVVMAVALTLLPAVAWADGGCGSGFESWGCFKLLLALLSLPALAVFGVSYPATVWALHRRARGAGACLKHMVLGLVLFPLAYVSTYAGMTLVTALGEHLGVVGGAYVAMVVVVSGLIQAGWAWGLVQLRRRNRSRRSTSIRADSAHDERID
ncbi:MAG: hypothetical protein AAFX99_33355 [Myxococcota bacterium]